MQKIRRAFFVAVICAILIMSVIPVFSFASCSHSSLGPRYCEATHPHEYYNQCTLCGVKIYTGEYATKNHGNGAWGSWTCPDCGTHTYTGRSCTTEGVCACGATIGAYEHLYNSTIQYETVHPHRAYMTCTRCGIVSYTGATETFAHGDGTNRTCADCGSHLYVLVSDPSSEEHPHQLTEQCACGDSRFRYPLVPLCASCQAGSMTATNSATESGVLFYLDGDQGLGVVVPCPVTITVTYSNTYNHPYPDLSTTYADYPPFASFYSRISTSVESPITGPEVMSTPVLSDIPYYNAQGNVITTQGIVLDGADSAVGTPGQIFAIWQNPAYTTVSGICNILGSLGTGDSVSCEVTTYFN